MFTPVQKSGELTAAQVPLYRVPDDRYAVLTAFKIVNGTGVDRIVEIFIRVQGDGTARHFHNALMQTGVASNNFSIEAERWILLPGTMIEGKQAAGNGIAWNLSALEYPMPPA